MISLLFVYIFFLCYLLNEVFSARRLIYIYNWSNSVIDVWPYQYSHHKLAFSSKSKENYGIGPEINASIGLYDTYQYSLFTTFYHRLLDNHNRDVITNNPNEASWFFIPYDLGMDSSVDKETGQLRRTMCPTMPTVKKLLENSPYFNQSNGSNHILIHSINQPMYHFVNLHCASLYRLCYHCIKLSIDTYPTSMYRKIFQDHPYLAYNWYSIPFPSSYHANKYLIDPPWKKINRKQRKYLVSFMGSAFVTAKIQQKLRIILMKECNDSKKCLLVTLSSHHVTSLHEIQDENRLLLPYSQSLFCLMPGGDFSTRKGFLDSLLSGCVPVTFQLISGQRQWSWHWESENVADDCSVFISREKVLRNVSIVFDILQTMADDEDTIHRKLKCISEVGYRMQYNHPYHQLSNIDAMDIVVEKLSQM